MNHEEKNEILSILTEMRQETNQRFDAMGKDLKDLKTDVAGLKTDMSSVKLILENEIRPNIQLLAEGHMGLVRQVG